VCAIGDGHVQIFHQIGWLKEMSLEQSDIVPFDEETKQKCEIFCDPSYQTRLIKEQVNHLLTPSLARYILSFRTTFGSGDVFPIFLFPFNSELPRIHPL
jgi:hypothetical protein